MSLRSSVRDLKNPTAPALPAGELRAAYEAWCAARDHKPLSMPKFAAELKALGYDKWKSCGLIRYRGLRFAA
jgi:phage/plasmid-associated DNA primase